MSWNILWSLSNRFPGFTWVSELHKMRKNRHILSSSNFTSKQGISIVSWIRYVSWIQKLTLLSSENHRAGSLIIDCHSWYWKHKFRFLRLDFFDSKRRQPRHMPRTCLWSNVLSDYIKSFQEVERKTKPLITHLLVIRHRRFNVSIMM